MERFSLMIKIYNYILKFEFEKNKLILIKIFLILMALFEINNVVIFL